MVAVNGTVEREKFRRVGHFQQALQLRAFFISYLLPFAPCHDFPILVLLSLRFYYHLLYLDTLFALTSV